MTTQAVTIHFPDSVYQRAQRTARALRKPLEKFLLDTVSFGLPLFDGLPPEIADDMAALTLLNDEALWRAGSRVLSPSKQEQLNLLLDKQGTEKLTVAERTMLDELLQEYERIVLIRAQAAVLLKQRGYDVSDPSVFNNPETL